MARKLLITGDYYYDPEAEHVKDSFDKSNENFEELYDAENTTGSARFSNPAGNWGDSPATPLQTATIDLSLTGALNAGTACVYYSGNVLTKDSFLPLGSVTFFSGLNRFNVLCAVWITYDKGSGAFHVNVRDDFTGDYPTPPITGDEPAQVTNLQATVSEITPPASETPALVTNLQATVDDIGVPALVTNLAAVVADI